MLALLAVGRLPAIALWLARGRLAAAGAEVTYARAALTPWGVLDVEGLRVRVESPAAGRRIALEVPRARIALGMGLRRLRISSARIERPEIAISWTAGAGRASPRPGGGAALPLSIGKLEVVDARLSYQDETAGPVGVTAEGIALRVASVGDDLGVDLESGPAALSSPRGVDEVAGVAGHFRLGPGGIGVHGARVRHGSGELLATGRIAFRRAAILHVTGSADMADLLGESLRGNGREPLVHGPVRIDAHLVAHIGGETLLVGTAWPAGPRRALGLAVRGSAERVVLAEGGIGLALEGPEPGALAVAFGGRGRATTYDGVIDASRDLAEIGRAFSVALPVDGHAEGRLHVGGEGPSFRLAGDVASDRLVRGGVAIGPVSGRIELDGEGIAIRARSGGPDWDLVADVASRFGSGRVSLDADVRRAPAAELRRLLALDVPLDGTLSGALHARIGPAGRLEAEGEVASAAPVLRGVALGPARATFGARQGQVSLAFEADSPTPARGTIEAGGGRARVTLEAAEMPLSTGLALASLPPLPYDARAAVAGTLLLGGRRPAARLDVALSGADVWGMLSVAGDRLSCAELAFRDGLRLALAPDGELEVRAPSLAALWPHLDRGSRAVRGTGLADPGVSTDALSFHGVLRQDPLALEGVVRASELRGPGSSLAFAEGSLALGAGEARLERLRAGAENGGSLTGELVASAAGIRGRLDAQDLPVRPWEGAAAALSGVVSFDERGVTGEVRARLAAGEAVAQLHTGERRQRADVTLQRFPLPGGLAIVDLRARLALAGGGDVEGEGRFAVTSDPKLGVPGVFGTLRGEGRRLVLEAKDQSGALAVRGAAGLDAGAWDLDATLAGFRPSQRLVARMAASLPLALAGPVAAQLSGRLHVDGTAGRVARMEVDVDGATLEVGGREVVREATARIQGRPGALDLEHLRIEGPDLHVATRPLPGGAATALQGDVDLAVGAALFAGVRSSGRIEGRWDPGSGRVELVVAEGEIGHEDLPWPIGALRGELSWGAEGVTVESIQGQLGEGSFRIDGTWGSVAALRMRLSPTALPSRQELVPGLRGRIGGRLTLEREPPAQGGRLVVGGKLTLRDGRYVEDVDLAELLVGRGRTPLPSGDEGARIDLDLAIDDPVQVRNNIVRGRLLGSLSLKGPLAAPRLGGRLELEERSEVELRGQTYEVSRAVLEGEDLRGGRYRGSLAATTTIRGYDIDLDLTGRGEGSRPATFRISYGASPTLPQEDVEALIMFGTTADRLPPGAARAFSGALLFAPLVKGIEGTSRWLLGMDRVRIEPYASRTEDVATARITVEKDIGKDLELIYSTSAGQEREDLIVIEYLGIPGGRRVTATREVDGSVTVEMGREVRFGSP